jgi:hypothetical protein
MRQQIHNLPYSEETGLPSTYTHPEIEKTQAVYQHVLRMYA